MKVQASGNFCVKMMCKGEGGGEQTQRAKAESLMFSTWPLTPSLNSYEDKIYTSFYSVYYTYDMSFRLASSPFKEIDL